MDVFSSAELTEEQKAQLRDYEYAGSDASLLLRLYRPVLEWMVTLLPLHTSPNLVTLLGFMCVNSAAVLTLMYSPDLKEPLPRLVYFYDAVAIWAYQWLDNLDGKQARRTRTSSAFGELFDHGVDAYASTSAAICFIAALQLGQTPLSLLTPFLIYFPFFFATWEQYWLGRMDLGPVNGAMEGIFGLVCIMFAGGIAGPALFTHRVGSCTVGELMSIGGFLLGLCCMAFNTKNVVAHNKLEQSTSLMTPLKQCTPLWFLLLCTVGCVADSSTEELNKNSLGIAYILVNGLIFGHIGTNLTLNHLSRVPFPTFFLVLIFPMWLATTHTVGSLFDLNIPQAGFAWCSVTVLLVHTVVYKALLIRSLLSTLRINLFTLTEEQKSRLVQDNVL